VNNQVVTAFNVGSAGGVAGTATHATALSWINTVSGGNWHIAVTGLDSVGSGGTVRVTHLGADGRAGTFVGGENYIEFDAADLTSVNRGDRTITATRADGQVDTLIFNQVSLGGPLWGDGAGFSLFASSANGADTGISVTTNVALASAGSMANSAHLTGNNIIYNFNSNTIPRTGDYPDSTVELLGDAGELSFSRDFAAPGSIARGDTRLRDIQQFWNSEGRFLLDDPQTITLTLGNGQSASVTLYGDDTIASLTAKLAQVGIVTSFMGHSNQPNVQFGANNPATFIPPPPPQSDVGGTIEMHSPIAGRDGIISIAGNESLLQGLGFGVRRGATESTFTISVTDAHTGETVAPTARITGSRAIGLVHPNIDIVFDPARFQIRADGTRFAEWDLHLADNTTVFQIGANEGEDMGVNIGDMRAEALGLNGVLVTNRESAARSITIIDNAIDRVSMQRARLGAYQNRLEHTINNLTVAGENLTAAESRIRDTDMAKEMMNFTRLSIMLQAGTSMLAQANMLPQNVLGLIR